MNIEEGSKPSYKKGGKVKSKKVSLAHKPVINACYQDTGFKEIFETSFRENKALEQSNGCCLHVSPFKACVMPNFLQDPKFLDALRDELLDQIFNDKNNDLYKFQQSDDLKKMSSPHVKALRKLFQNEVCDMMQEITGLPLNNKVDLTCSRYDYTDILLCHDDELDTRKIAFILYLVPTWREEDGGALDLFDMDDHLQPRSVVRSILPAWNQLSWFEVTEASHHQVAEVLSPDKTRLSVNGWFHGPPVPRPERYIEPAQPLQPYCPLEEEEFYEWINPIYLDPEVQGQIQEKFESNSEIELQGFLKDEKYTAVLKALSEDGVSWNHRKPPNKRNYKSADHASLPDILRQCLQFLQSEPMFLTLSNLTGLSLHELAPEDSDNEGNDKADEAETSSTVCAPDEPESEKVETKDCHKTKRRKLNSESNREESMEQDEAKIETASKKACNPRCRGEVRQWEHGSYTLVHDTDAELGSDFALDAMLYCGCGDWKEERGGHTTYIAKGEDEELLTVVPAENSLALVYRDKDTLRFVKHINNRVNENGGSKNFYDFSLVYYE